MKKILFFFFTSLFLFSCSNEQEFDKNFVEALDAGVSLHVICDDVCNQTSTAWHKAIFDHRDMNGRTVTSVEEGIRNLHKVIDFESQYILVDPKTAELNSIVKRFENCPKSRKEAYEDLLEYISSINDLSNLAVYPEGTLQSYNSSTTDLSRSIRKQYGKIKLKYSSIIENTHKQ